MTTQGFDFSGVEARFELTDAAGWLDHLEQHGFVVVGAVLADDELERARTLLWEYLETQGMLRDDPSTWLENYPGDPLTGICPIFGAPQSDFAWFVRSHPNVVEAFASVWGAAPEDLITSFDAVNVFRPFTKHPTLKTKARSVDFRYTNIHSGVPRECAVCRHIYTRMSVRTSTHRLAGSILIRMPTHLGVARVGSTACRG